MMPAESRFTLFGIILLEGDTARLAYTGNSASQPFECAKRTMAARERSSSF